MARFTFKLVFKNQVQGDASDLHPSMHTKLHFGLVALWECRGK